MADIHRRLAKHYLEDLGFVTATDVACPCTAEGMDRPDPLDILAVKISKGRATEVVVGLVRGWWHMGANLTPSLIRLHLETDRKLLTSAFSINRISEVLKRFGLEDVPLKKVLFFSQRSPQKAKEAEKLLADMGLSAVYLEDVITEILPRRYREGAVTDDDLMAIMQTTKQAQFARKFKEKIKHEAMQKEEEKRKNEDLKRKGKIKAEKKDPQMDFLTKLLKEP